MIGFEDPAAVAQLLGGPVDANRYVPGSYGKALTDVRPDINPKVVQQAWNPQAGTVMAWMKLRSRPEKTFMVRWLIILDPSRLDVATDDRGEPLLFPTGTVRRSPARIETGDWHHWAFRWDGNSRQVLLDGKLVYTGTAKPFQAKAPRIVPCLGEGQTSWAMDDLKFFTRAIGDERVVEEMARPVVRDYIPGQTDRFPDQPAGAKIAVAPPDYDADNELMANPALAGGTGHWFVMRGRDAVEIAPTLVRIHNREANAVSVLAQATRSAVVPGRAYRLTLRYRLQSHGARVLLRFRNQVDQGTQSFVLPDQAEFQRRSFFALAPGDTDVGLYFLEVLVEGRGADMEIRGAYLREATAAETAAADLKPAEEPFPLQQTVKPDESWIAAIPKDFRPLAAGERRLAWGLDEPRKGQNRIPLAANLQKEGDSLVLEHSPKDLLTSVRGIVADGGLPTLRVQRKRRDSPGGAGLDPLPARSTCGAALLLGIGAEDTGIGSYQHKRLAGLLERFGYFDPNTRFVPFWDSGGLFRHTAPGVLVSAYVNNDTRRALLVLVNYTDQEMGKMGDVAVKHKELLGSNWDRQRDRCTDPETGARALPDWNRVGKGGYVRDVWCNVAVPPGDYRLMLLEIDPKD